MPNKAKASVNIKPLIINSLRNIVINCIIFSDPFYSPHWEAGAFKNNPVGWFFTLGPPSGGRTGRGSFISKIIIKYSF
jgi:hypothetical protein